MGLRFLVISIFPHLDLTLHSFSFSVASDFSLFACYPIALYRVILNIYPVYGIVCTQLHSWFLFV